MFCLLMRKVSCNQLFLSAAVDKTNRREGYKNKCRHHLHSVDTTGRAAAAAATTTISVIGVDTATRWITGTTSSLTVSCCACA